MFKSCKTKDILLTTDKLHAKYKAFHSKFGEAQISKILQAFEELKRIDTAVSEEIIEKIFNKYNIQWLLQEWKKQGVENFKANLNEFNKRKEFISKNSIREFLSQFEYFVALRRFYNTYVNVKNNLEQFPML